MAKVADEYRTIQLQLIEFMRHGAITWVDLKDAADAMFIVRIRYKRLFCNSRDKDGLAPESEGDDSGG